MQKKGKNVALLELLVVKRSTVFTIKTSRLSGRFQFVELIKRNLFMTVRYAD